MATILLTGATGRLGGNVTAELVKRGHTVRALVIPDDPKGGKLAPFDVEIIEGDLRDPAVSDRVLAGADSVIHTANILGPPPGMSRDAFFAISITGTFNLLEAAGRRADQLERFVHISSDAVADARDVALATVQALEHPAAVGEVFNVAVPRPFTFGEVARYMAEQTGDPFLTFEVPQRWVHWSDVRKLRSQLDCEPQCDLPQVFGTALAHARGEPADVVPA